MIVVTTDTIPERRIKRTLGLVRGNTVRARHVGHDIIAQLKNLAGGELPNYTKMIAEAREQALDRMVAQADSLGANAIVGMKFMTSTIMQGAAEIICYGTAVEAE